MAVPSVEDTQSPQVKRIDTAVAFYNPKTKRTLLATAGLRKYATKLKLTPIMEMPKELKSQKDKNIEAAIAKKEAEEKAEAEKKPAASRAKAQPAKSE